jgi:Spy/CpxP family protein refolding chaperone
MRRAWMGWWLAVLLVWSTPVFAQVPAASGPPAVANTRAVVARARMLRQRVGLGEATAQRVEQVLAQFDAQHAAVRAQVEASHRTIRRLVQANSMDEDAYRQAVEALRSVRIQQQALLNREFDELKNILLPSQQARLLLHRRRLNRDGGSGPAGGVAGRGPCAAGPCGAGAGRRWGAGRATL